MKPGSGQGNPHAHRPARRRWLLRIAAAVIAIPVLLFLALIPGGRRDHSVPAVPESWETGALAKLSMRVGTRIFDRGGKLVPRAEIEFDENELNAAIRNALRFAFRGANGDMPSVGAVWRAGGVDADISAPLWPAGAVNISLRLIPVYAAGEFRCIAEEVRVGRLPLPAAFVSDLLNRRIAAEIAGNPEAAAALEAVESIAPSASGGMSAVIYPRQAPGALRLLLQR